MSVVRVVARLGESFIVATGAVAKVRPESRSGSELFLPARRYDPKRDELSPEHALGSWVKFCGGYFEEPNLDEDEERRVLHRVAELLRADEDESRPG